MPSDEDKARRPATVCAVIISYNSASYLPACLESLLRQSYRPMNIVVVDNASTDGSADVCRKFDVHLIENQSNTGFAAANNQAVRYARQTFDPQFVLLINPDTISDERLVEEMVASLSADPAIGIVQGKLFLMRERELLNASGIRHHFLYFGSCEDFRQPDTSRADRELPVASGACMMFKREVLEQLGYLFDDQFFMYHEDSDFCLRARLRGYRIVLSAAAHTWHDYRFGSAKTKFFHMEKNRLFLVLQNYRASTLALLLPAIAFTEPQVMGFAALQGWLGSKLASYGWLLRNLHTVLAKRRQIAKDRRSDDSELLRLFAPTLSFEAINNPIVNRITNPVLDWYFKGLLGLVARLESARSRFLRSDVPELQIFHQAPQRSLGRSRA